ncbi:MAG: WYL domain-containing protein [Bacteroidia bacterium]
MSVNKNALIRYKTIDKCLQNRYRKWTLEDLIEACSNALYEYEGIDKGVSKRTVQADIQIMRSDKLGYFAPIIVLDKKYYTYEDSNYSITNIPLTEQDLSKLTEAVEFMKQFQGFSHFRELDGMVQKLEDHIYSQKTSTQPVIDFEKNENLKGLQYLDSLYNSIIKKQAIRLTYKSFKARNANSFDFYPYLLKEFRNRWFVIGSRSREKNLLNLALDRIVALERSSISYVEPNGFDPTSYFQNAIGVSISPEAELMDVVLFVEHAHAPYIITKPLHHSQQVIERDSFGVTFTYKVQHNFELEKEILSFGESIKVLEPAKLQRRINDRLLQSVSNYSTELSSKNIKGACKKLQHKGYAVLNNVYSLRDLRKLKRALDKAPQLQGNKNKISERALLNKHPDLLDSLMNKSLQTVIKTIDKNAFITKAIYFNKSSSLNWYVTWHQDRTINVTKKVTVDEYSGWTTKDKIVSVCPPQEILKKSFTIRIHLDEVNNKNGGLQVIPGSHKKIHSDEEKTVITENTDATDVDVNAGGIMLMKPLILHKSSKTKNQKQRRTIHIEFCSARLAKELEWSEKITV